ncbi:hypothetical protein HW509_07100 [Asaia spathodeae]
MNAGAIDHVLAVIGEAQIDQRLQHCVPDALLGPAAEADIDRIPPAIALVHVSPRAADAQYIEHAAQETAVVARRPRSGGDSDPTHVPLCVR